MTDLLAQLGQGWYLTLLSSCLCVSGCFIIFFDDIYRLVLPASFTRSHPFKIKENYTFLNGSLGFSSGCLLFTSLYRLLPEAYEYLLKSAHHEEVPRQIRKRLTTDLIWSYIGGILICLLFNYLLHLITSESVVHCGHSDDKNETHSHSLHDLEAHDHFHGDPNHGDHHHNESTHHHHHDGPPTTEHSPLLAPESEVKPKKLLLHLFTAHPEADVGECKGYSSAEACLFKSDQDEDPHNLHYCEISSLDRDGPDVSLVSAHDEAPLGGPPAGAHAHSHPHAHPHAVSRPTSISLARTHTNDHHHHKEDHHHHVNTPLSRLLLIGIQTTLAITLHKFPEGFITYITSETNPELGVLIFLSLLFHNFSEGFLMCLPLYYLFSESSNSHYAKIKAVLISGLLGGLSQPLGAVAGYFFISFNNRGESVDIYKLNFIFGVTLAVTSGFLSVIGLSMYSTGVSFSSGSLNFVMTWCLIGMVVIGLLTTFTA